jgi:hypothetical protein
MMSLKVWKRAVSPRSVSFRDERRYEEAVVLTVLTVLTVLKVLVLTVRRVLEVHR